MLESEFQEETIVSDPFYCRWSYESFLLRMPQVRTDGLWSRDGWFYIVCPGVEDSVNPETGLPLTEWFEHHVCVLGSPVRLVSAIPEGAIPVPERTAEERAESIGAPLRIRDLYVELSFQLPNDFPPFELRSDPPNVIVSVAHELTEDETLMLHSALSIYCPALTPVVIVECTHFEEPRSFRWSHGSEGDIDLIPSHHPSMTVTRALREVWEEDEDFWVDQRRRVLAADTRSPQAMLRDSFTRSGSRCLVDATVFPPKNLRTYLSLFRRVIIAMPLESRFEHALLQLKVTENELAELARNGRVQFVLPQPVDRYPIRFIELLADAASEALLFSRRLAAATIVDGRRRIPLLYPPLEVSERRYLLDIMARAKLDPTRGNIGQVISKELSRIWSSIEDMVNARGAMATMALGFGPILAEIFKYATQRDLMLELMTASGIVEWGGALQATVFATNADGYSDQAAVEFCASAYSGIGNNPIPTAIGEVETILDGLLAIDNDAPILEFAEAFSNTDIDRLGNVVCGIAQQSTTPESIDIEVKEMNSKVKAYEREAGRLTRWNLVGLGGIMAGLLHPHPGMKLISLGIWLSQYIFKDADPSNDLGGRALDWIRGVNAWTTGDVVLVSRLKKKV